MFLKFWINFSIYLKEGANFEKLEIVLFYFGLYIFSKIVMHFLEICLGEKNNNKKIK